MDNGLGNSVLAGGLNEDKKGQQSNINISDVIEVIHETDPAYREALQESRDSMYGVAAPAPPPDQVRPQPKVFVRITEQPAPKALRFRYECEGRSAGSIPGVRSTPENKTYPAIEVLGYKGRAVVVVSCVTKDEPYKPHPHNLVGKDGCKKGVCTLEINPETMSISFSNLGIQCVKKKDIEEALTQREELRVDPFKTGFSHKSQPSLIDLNAVRLCFQVFVEDQRATSTVSRLRVGLQPVVSDIIYDKKAMSDLAICKLSHFSASMAGGQEVIMLCEKVAKEDIMIRFFEEQEGKVFWEGHGDFQHTHVHKQVAIAFRTPPYTAGDTNRHVKVFIQLRRPSDGATSEPMPFELKPMDADREYLKRKRQKMSPDTSNYWFTEIPQETYTNTSPINNAMYNIINPQQQQQPIKLEPGDTSPYGAQFGNYRNIPNTPSPQYKAPTPSPPLPLHTDPNYYHLWNFGAASSNAPHLNVPQANVSHANVPQSNVPLPNVAVSNVQLSNVAQSSMSGVAQLEQQGTNSASNLFNMDRQQFDQMPQLSTDEWHQLMCSAARPDDIGLDQVESSMMRLSTEQEASNLHIYNNFDRLN